MTVTTSATTFVVASGPRRGDITDGATVMVRGSRSAGAIKAAIVTVGQPFSAVDPAGFVPVQGTVADAGPDGFTLVESGGARIPVTTTADTLVVIPHASAAQLRSGTTVFAVVRVGPGGTLLAQAVAAVTQLPSGPRNQITLKTCSASSIEEALGALSAAPAAAG